VSNSTTLLDNLFGRAAFFGAESTSIVLALSNTDLIAGSFTGDACCGSSTLMYTSVINAPYSPEYA